MLQTESFLKIVQKYLKNMCTAFIKEISILKL